jgi:hypothetical protein
VSTNTRAWLKGLISAVLGAVSNGLGSVMIDGANGQVADLPRAGLIAMFGGITALVGYLKQSPFPEPDPVVISRKELDELKEKAEGPLDS